MNIRDLTIDELKRAVIIKEQILSLNKELRSIFGVPHSRASGRNSRTMGPSARRKIAAAQKARWAKLRRAKAGSGKPAAKKKTMSAAARAKLSAKMKRYWAAQRRAAKK